MHPESLNPHVLISLFCLAGILCCLLLIGWGMWSDRRRSACENEPAPAEPSAHAQRNHLSVQETPRLVA